MVDRSSFSCVGSVFHARGSATEKALSLIRRRVGRTTRLPDDDAGTADRAGTSPTDVSKSDTYSGVCPRSDLCTRKHNLNWILSAAGSQCNSWRAAVTRSRGLISRTVRRAGLAETVPVGLPCRHASLQRPVTTLSLQNAAHSAQLSVNRLSTMPASFTVNGVTN